MAAYSPDNRIVDRPSHCSYDSAKLDIVKPKNIPALPIIKMKSKLSGLARLYIVCMAVATKNIIKIPDSPS